MFKRLLHTRSVLMRRLFYLLYHEFAWSYDWVANLVSLGMWQDWIFTVLPYIQGPIVLELGSGPGHLQVALKLKGIRVVGLDASRQMAEQSVSRMKKSEQTPGVVIGYAQYIPCLDDSFQQVLATFPSEYIFKADALQEIYRVLVPGGDCFILPAAWINPSPFKFRLAARLFEITGQTPIQQPDWKGPFIRAGFSVETIPIELPRSRLILIHARKTS